jgi:eukaryotic-like serine/threonine-protein kinase
VAVAVTWLVMPADVAPRIFRAQLSPAPDQLSIDFFVGDLDMSDDGSSVAYAAGRNGAIPEIFVRRLDQEHAVALPGTKDGRAPIFSADRQWVSFQLGTNLVKVPVNGGAQQTVCLACAGGYRGGAWLPDGSFVYSTGGGQSGLRLVPPDAASYEVLTTIDRAGNERTHTFPHALPNGRGILFTIDNLAGDRQIAVIDLQSKRVKVLARGGSSPQYSPSGHLLYAASGTLYAVPFDLDGLELTGAATPVVNGLVTKSSGAADYTVAGNGSIVYVSGDPVVSTYTVTVRDGSSAPQALPLPPGGYVMARFSPDGTQAVADSRSNDMDLWVWSFAQKLARRLTFSPRQDQYPVWTPDGRHIVYSGVDGTKPAIFRQAADGSGTPERVTLLETVVFPTGFTPDGATLLAHTLTTSGAKVAGIFTIAMTGDHTPHLLEHTARNPINAQVSPDGRWIAYQTIESGRSEVIVQPFPNLAGGRWQISTEGGSQPLFSLSGTQLFYRDPERRLMSVPLQFSPQFSPGNPTVVMENVFSPGPGRPYDIAKDGRILLVNESRTEQPASRSPQLNVILNWTQELKRLVPTTR